MTALAASKLGSPTRRQRAGELASAAFRGGLLAGATAALAWLLATVIAGTAFVVLLFATVAVIVITLLGRDVSGPLWIGLALAWAAVLLERAIVNAHGGVWVGIAAFVGVVIAARRAGMPKWALALLGYPLISVAICIAAGQNLLDPWGISWLWVGAALGPPLGAKVLLDR